MKESPQSFDVFATRYDSAVSIERAHGFFLDHLPTKRDCALDVGCGSGLLSLELSRHFRQVIALDISEPMLALARKKRSAPNIDYRLCDADGFAGEAVFDAIVSHTTLHHLPNVPATLAKLKSWLAPNGRLMIVDCVARLPGFIPRWSIFYRAYALMQFIPDIIRRGPKAAGTLLLFRSCRAWIEHRTSDRYFSPREFRQVYTASLPDAQFTRMKSFMGVLWAAPVREEKTERTSALQTTPGLRPSVSD
jgi:ubiquinone/menaquinone biosynthesis C-methylase UbiE